MMDLRTDQSFQRIGDDEVGELVRAAGPRAELPEFDLAAIRAKTCAAWELEVRSSKRRAARTWLSRLSIAAAVGGALLLVWLLRERGVAPGPVDVASVELVSGTVMMLVDGSESRAVSRGDHLVAGASLETGNDAARASIRLGSGITMRFDEATRARFVSADVVRLDEGALYVDTAGVGEGARGDGARRIEIRTPSGTARDIGTQFEVRVLDSTRAMLVRVREGKVLVERDGSRREAGAGTELVIEEDGRFSERAVRSWGAGWEWILAAAPRYEIEGRTLREFLGWVRRETGWAVRFSDPALETRAGEIVLHGTIEGTRPDEAPFAVLAGSGLSGELVEGTLVIREGGAK